MQDDSGFYGPLLYQDVWLWLGVVLLVVVAAWYAWLFLPSPRRAVTAAAPPDVEGLRASCLAAIDAVAADVDAGTLGERDAHQRLSFLVRDWAVAGIYPAEFAPTTSASIRESADAARRAVLEWN
jgi:hypothetical protein